MMKMKVKYVTLKNVNLNVYLTDEPKKLNTSTLKLRKCKRQYL